MITQLQKFFLDSHINHSKRRIICDYIYIDSKHNRNVYGGFSNVTPLLSNKLEDFGVQDAFF